MTENEIREEIKDLKRKANIFENSGYATVGISLSLKKAVKVIEFLLEEIQQYKEIGTVERFRFLQEVCDLTGDELEHIANSMIELKNYRAIGTIEEFKALKDAEEQGLLLRLPYPLGTKKVYAIDEDYGGVCDIIELDARDLQIDKSDISDRPIFIIDTFEYYEGDFGKTVFLTKKEAEQALQKMKEGAV